MQQAEREQQTRLAGGEASIQPTVQALPWCEGLSQLPLHVIPSNPNGTPVKIKSSGLVQTNLAIRPATMGIQQSSQPGDLDAVFNEHRQWPVAPTVLPQPPGEYMVPLTQLQLGHSVQASFPYAYTDPCFGGYVSAFMVHPYLIGMQQTCLPLPSDMSEEPVLVNRKQFHGIMRRRRLRAKAESQNKLIKTRKPYLHESRHLHAMRRARGSGGRFLNTRNKEMGKTNNSNKSSEEQSSQRSSSPDATFGYMALSGSKCSMDKTVPAAEREIKQGAGYSNVTSAGCMQSHNEYAIMLSGTVQGNFRKSYQNQALDSSAFRSLTGGSHDGHCGQLGSLYQMGHSKQLLNYSATENIII